MPEPHTLLVQFGDQLKTIGTLIVTDGRKIQHDKRCFSLILTISLDRLFYNWHDNNLDDHLMYSDSNCRHLETLNFPSHV